MAQTITGVTPSDLGIGGTRDNTSNRRYTSAPDNYPADFSVEEDRLTTIVETCMRRKETILTPDNAHSILSTSFDIKAFIQRLSGNVALVEDEQALFEILKGCVIDKEIVAFNKVAKRHLTALGLGFSYTLKLDKERAEAANAPNSFPNSNLNQQDFLKHFNVSMESGFRCVIDQYLLAAAVYAQSTIDSDENLKNELFDDFRILDPHVAVFTTPQVPHTRVSSDGTSYVFHGSFDYGMGFIESRDVASLARGSLGIDVSEMSSGVVVAKSLPQITVQVLTPVWH